MGVMWMGPAIRMDQSAGIDYRQVILARARRLAYRLSGRNWSWLTQGRHRCLFEGVCLIDGLWPKNWGKFFRANPEVEAKEVGRALGVKSDAVNSVRNR